MFVFLSLFIGNFARYDYGILGNLKHYKQRTPPVYNLSSVKAPVFLMWGPEDWLADPTVSIFCLVVFFFTV